MATLNFSPLLLLTLLSTGAFAVPNKGAPVPIPPVQSFPPISGAPADVPSRRLPTQCVAERNVRIENVISRRVTWTDLNTATCTYERGIPSVTDGQISAACATAAASHGASGSFECRKIEQLPARVDVEVGCQFPVSVFKYESFDVLFTLSDRNFKIVQCRAIDDCMKTQLGDPSDFLLARQWGHQLKCW